MTFNPENLGILCAFLSSCTWAIGISAYAKLSRDYPPFVINLFRGLLALPFFLALVMIESSGVRGGVHELLSVDTHRLVWLAVSVVMSYAVGDVVFMWSSRSLGVPGALAIASTYPLWAALGGWLLNNESLGGRRLVGLLLVVFGTIVVILNSRGHRPERKAHRPEQKQGVGIFLENPRFGVALAFLASFMWGLNSFSVAKGGHGLSTPVINSYRMAFAIVLTPLFGRLTNRGGPYFLPRNVLRRFIWVFAVESLGGAFFFAYGMSHAPLSIGAGLTALAPVLAVPIAVLTRTEKFSFFKTLAVSGVAVGMFLLISSR